VRIEWLPRAREQAREHMKDQASMLVLVRSVETLADDPEHPEAIIRGRYRRLHAGPWRVLYEVGDDLIIVVRVDRVVER
jgi:mRNA-degrading endonuclease RelE of RelBE toxin-antitoxin system